jgi:hypothetical protein
MIPHRLGLTLIAAASLAVLAGCGIIPSTPINNATFTSPTDAAYDPNVLGANGINLLGGDKKRAGEDDNGGGTGVGGGIGVNAYLWRGALDTLSFMPLASADPFGGVIITDWYQPPASSDERFKATAYITSRQLRADGVKLTIFRQVEQNGQWVDAPVDPVTIGQIEDKLLARARELRAQQPAS